MNSFAQNFLVWVAAPYSFFFFCLLIGYGIGLFLQAIKTSWDIPEERK